MSHSESVPFASVLTYPPRWQKQNDSTEALKQRNAILKLKRADPRVLSKAVERIYDEFGRDQSLADFFGDNTILVPAPGHAVKMANSQWPTRTLAEKMEAKGLGHVRCWLKRELTVRKSALAASSERPTWRDHLESIKVQNVQSGDLIKGFRITVVDDIVTTGATLFACIQRLLLDCPGIEVRGFAVARSVQDFEFNSPIETCAGSINAIGDRTFRQP